MANISGGRITTGITQARRVVDMSKEIALLDPSIAPFVTILKRVRGGGTRVAISPKIEWMEDDYLGTTSTVPTATLAATTTLVVGDGTIFRAGDVANLPATGENVLVTAVSTNDLTVVRGYGSTAAADTTDGDAIIIIGSAHTENSTGRARASTQEVAKFNYTQIFRTPFELSNTLAASELYGGNDVAYQRKKILAEHKKDIARAMYFGQKKEDTSSGVRRTMGGLLEYIKTGSNTQAFASGGTTFTYKNFDTYVAQPAFLHGAKEKLMVVGTVTASAINNWAMGDLMTSVGGDTYGVNIKKLETSYGIFNIVYDPLLDGTTYGGYGMVLDMDNIEYAYLKGRDTKLHTNIQPADQDGVIDEYRTECSLVLKSADTHFLFTGAYVI